jgi:hypothetical protein
MSASTDAGAAARLRHGGPVLARVLLVVLACALAGAPALADALTIRVGEPLRPISPDAITGFNTSAAVPVVLYLDEWAAVDIRSLRFPPGNDADDFVLTVDTMRAFAQTWQLLGEPDVHLVANFFEGADHAVAVARALGDLGITPRWWAVGNEPDLYPRNRMDPSWTAEVYCQRFRAMRAALEAELGDVRMSGPAVSGSRPSAMAYLREVITRCGDVIDLVTWHVYPTDGSRSDEDALATSRAVAYEIAQVRAWLADPEVNPLGYTREVPIGITEFGLSWRTSTFRHLEDMVAALWLAEALGQMATEGLDLGQYFALQAMGGHGLIDRGGWVRHTYHVYAMLAGFGGTAHGVEGGDDRLAAYAAADDGALRVLLVNRSNESIDVTLVADAVAAELHVTTLDDPTFDEVLGPMRAVQSADDGVHVPPRSVVLVRSQR